MARRWLWCVLVLLAALAAPAVEARVADSASSNVAAAAAALTGPKEKLCATCQKAAEQVMLVLSDPQTAQQTIAVLEGLICTQLPGDLLAKCAATVEDYVPQVILNLQETLNADTMCVQTHICEPVPNEDMNPALSAIEDTPRCNLCRQIAAQVLVLLESGKTQEQILTLMHRACQKVKGAEAIAKCDNIVDVYVPQLIALLATVTPEDVCRLAKYCYIGSFELAEALAAQISLELPSVSGKNLARIQGQQAITLGGPTRQECAACRFLVIQARKKLKEPGNQVKLTVFLTETCNKVADYKEQCKAMVTQYLPLFFANIDTLMDPTKLCAKANLCPDRGLSTQPRLIRLPGAA